MKGSRMVSDLEYGDMQVIILMFSLASALFPTQGQKHLLQFQLGNSLPVRLLSQIVVESFQLFCLGQQTVQLFLLLFPLNVNIVKLRSRSCSQNDSSQVESS